MPMFDNTSSSQTTTQDTTQDTTTQTVEETTVEENIPDINLIVENGNGQPDANSYCDLDFALEYCTMKGYSDWQKLSENEQKIYLIRGTEFVDNYYEWKGFRRLKNQSMAFPRVELYDTDHYEVEGIPERLKKACVEAAWLNASSGTDTLFTTEDENGKIKRQKVDSLEVEYFEKSSSSSTNSSEIDYTSIYGILNKLLKGLYKTGSSASRVCSRVIQTGW